MTGIDGKEYENDTWYPLPFVINGHSMIPFHLDSVESSYLFVRREDGTERHWGPWNHQRGEILTHWCARLDCWYQI